MCTRKRTKERHLEELGLGPASAAGRRVKQQRRAAFRQTDRPAAQRAQIWRSKEDPRVSATWLEGSQREHAHRCLQSGHGEVTLLSEISIKRLRDHLLRHSRRIYTELRSHMEPLSPLTLSGLYKTVAESSKTSVCASVCARVCVCVLIFLTLRELSGPFMFTLC